MDTTLTVLNSDSEQAETVDLDPRCLEREKGDQAVHDVVVALQAARRAGTASAKNRAKIRGSGAKPYRQKGTGRARAGTRKSPLWRSGGVIFGPEPRSFAKSVNRKVKILALRRTFTECVDEGDLIVVEDITLDAPKTKKFAEFLRSIGAGENALVLVSDSDTNISLAARNMPNVSLMTVGSVNAYWMLFHRKVVVTRAGLEKLCTRIARPEGESTDE